MAPKTWLRFPGSCEHYTPCCGIMNIGPGLEIKFLDGENTGVTTK